MGQSIDIVATRGRWVTAIEVKVSDWRRGLQQTRAHCLIADYVCVAIGTRNVSEQLRSIAQQNGTGLLHVGRDGTCRWVVRPLRSRLVWRPQRRVFARGMRRVPCMRAPR